MENENENVKGSGKGGKYNSLPKEYRKKLSAPMPRQAIKQHPTKSYLSTIKAIYITERLNDVFGILGWEMEHEVESITKDNDKDYVVVKGRLYVREFDLYTPFQYGGHQLEGKGTEPADGYKSAVTDMQGKCASLIEIGIQVFKGEPNSQVANVSKVVAESKPQEEEAKAEPKKTESKKPAAKKPAAKKPADKEEPVDKKTVDKKTVDKEEPAEVLPTIVTFEQLTLAYVDADTLKKEAGYLIKEAQQVGLDDDDVETLKKSINDRYLELKS